MISVVLECNSQREIGYRYHTDPRLPFPKGKEWKRKNI